MNTIEFNKVWKKFKKGERFNSLRDAIPNLFKKAAPATNLEEKEFWAVKDVDFHVKKGEVVGIIGPNGAGKSTILKLLSRIMDPDKGSMSIKGRLSALIEVTAGFHPELTGRENVYLNGTILGMQRKEIDEKFREIVEFSGLGEFIDTPVKRYSSGMFSRLGFSVAAYVNPDILLVDEVLSVGDIAFQSKCAQKIRELLSSGVTIILVSHNMQLIHSLCKRTLLINKGQIVKEGAPEEVVPYYENIIFQEQENEVRDEIGNTDHKVRLHTEEIIEISNVAFYDEHFREKTMFKSDDAISIRVDYNAKQTIDRPVFAIELIRADGVLCCYSDTCGKDIKIEQINGKGTIKVHFGKINLAPGIYMVKIIVWDRDMLHPFVTRKNDIFRIDIGSAGYSMAVFMPRIEWEV